MGMTAHRHVGQGLVLGLERPLPLRWRLGDPHYNAYCTRRGLKGAAAVLAAAPTHCFEEREKGQ